MGGRKGAARVNSTKSRSPWLKQDTISPKQAKQWLAEDLLISADVQRIVIRDMETASKSAKSYNALIEWGKKFKKTASALAAVTIPTLPSELNDCSLQTDGHREYLKEIHQQAQQQLEMLRATSSRMAKFGGVSRGKPHRLDLAMFAVTLPTLLRQAGCDVKCTPTILALFARAIGIKAPPSKEVKGFDSRIRYWKMIQLRANRLVESHREGILKAAHEEPLTSVEQRGGSDRQVSSGDLTFGMMASIID